MFLVYICISPRCKSLPLKRKKHDDGTGLVKMQEDPRSSTCCCTAKYFLWGANLHSLNFDSVFWKDFEIVFDSKWPQSIPPPPILWNCQKLKQKLTHINNTCVESHGVWKTHPDWIFLGGFGHCINYGFVWLSK